MFDLYLEYSDEEDGPGYYSSGSSKSRRSTGSSKSKKSSKSSERQGGDDAEESDLQAGVVQEERINLSAQLSFAQFVDLTGRMALIRAEAEAGALPPRMSRLEKVRVGFRTVHCC